MNSENTIQLLQTVLGVIMVVSFGGCSTPQAKTADNQVAKHDQEIPSVTIHTNYPISQGPVNIRTNYPSPNALLWSINYKYYPKYIEQDDSERAFWEGIGGMLRAYCPNAVDRYINY